MTKQRLDFIDSLRGWAVLGVIAVHSNALIFHQLPSPVQVISSAGARGVQLFFILSAFSLFYSLDRRKVKGNQSGYIDFLARRFFRIGPMFYLAIAIYGFGLLSILYPQTYHLQNYSTYNILAYFTFTHGFWPNYTNNLVPGGWSIATEMTFYIFVPLLFKKIKDLKGAIWFFCVALVWFIFNSVLSFQPGIFPPDIWGNFRFFILPSQLIAFALGVVLYMLFKNINLYRYRHYSNQIFILGTLTAILMLVNGLYQTVIFSIPLFLISWSLSIRPMKLFVNRYMSFFGKISFSVYLLHFLIIPAVHNFIIRAIPPPLNGWTASLLYLEILIIATIIVIPFAYLGYILIERPGIAIGEKIIGKAILIKFKYNKEYDQEN